MSQPASPSRKPSRAKWYILGGVVVVGALVGSRIVARRNQAEIIPITTDRAIVKTITQLVTATGKVQPEVEVKISPEVGGELIDLPLKEGAPVKKGELLVKIRPDTYTAGLEQQEASLAAAQAAAVLSKAHLTKAEEDLRQAQQIYSKKLLSDADFITTKTNYDVAKADYDSNLARIRQTEGSVAQARDLVSKTVIYSPIDGTISALECEIGERVIGGGTFSGTEIMRIADLDSMEIRVKVNENDIVNVKVGDHALISIDAFPNRRFNGNVTEISNSGVAGSQGSDDVTNFQVKIRITDHGVQLRPGMSATADIETQTVENVVAVPIQSVTVRAGGLTSEEMQQQKAKAALEKSGNALDVAAERGQAKRDRDKLQRGVFVKQGDTVKLVTVETGIADNTHIEVKSGIKAGDEVVSGSYAAISRRLKDGSRVVIEKPKPDTKK
ncbi:MAG TPA: efflux RND transporter periplasmic adaptor subunit [Opitutaceae bacterium]|nr:efflux RND transporter periplasmic adaptor subunit [Opitutaceae bacterium]